MKLYHKLLLYRNKHLGPYIKFILGLITVLTNIASFLLIAGVVYQHGFPMSGTDLYYLKILFRWIWIIYFIYVGLQLSLNYELFSKRFKRLTWVLPGLLALTLIPVLFRQPPGDGIIEKAWVLFHSESYRLGVLALYSILNLSDGLVRMLGKRTNPSLILAVSFLAIIIVGTGLLLLPHSVKQGVTLAWVDALFTSTSAVCVTGLTTVDVSSTFSTMGLVIIIILIQVGGLGVMTLTSFFAMFFMGNTSLYNQLVVRDMVSSDSLNSLLSTLLYILFFTLFIEFIGMMAIWLSVHGTLDMSIQQELAFSAFHSISAFCNAGFSTLPDNLGYYKLMTEHNWFYIIISFLILFGGIGFPILVNLKEIIAYHLKHFWKCLTTFKFTRYKRQHLYVLNTRIVLIMTLLLTVGGTLTILYFEWNESFAGMPVANKWTQAFFNAVCPRTAGFNSVDLTSFTLQSILIYTFLMWVGGGAQSTAGGIKVNAFAVIVLNVYAVIRGTEKVNIFHRQLTPESIRRSNATVILSIGVLSISIFMISIWQPEMPIMTIIFECVSAISTVGSSLDATSLLGVNSKLLISFLMFIGRVGLITLMLGIVKQKKFTNYSYPQDNIIIN